MFLVRPIKKEMTKEKKEKKIIYKYTYTYYVVCI